VVLSRVCTVSILIQHFFLLSFLRWLLVYRLRMSVILERTSVRRFPFSLGGRDILTWFSRWVGVHMGCDFHGPWDTVQVSGCPGRADISTGTSEGRARRPPRWWTSGEEGIWAYGAKIQETADVTAASEGAKDAYISHARILPVSSVVHTRPIGAGCCLHRLRMACRHASMSLLCILGNSWSAIHLACCLSFKFS
jgi:hypothetical protein